MGMFCEGILSRYSYIRSLSLSLVSILDLDSSIQFTSTPKKTPLVPNLLPIPLTSSPLP